jgi:hypothetical protein
MDIQENIRAKETLEEKAMAQIMAIHRHDSCGIHPKTCQGIPLTIPGQIIVFLGFDASSKGKWFPKFPRKVSYSPLRCTLQEA